jgi:hypothetical protein
LEGEAVSAVEALKAARAAGVELRVNGEALVLEAAEPPPADVIDLLTRHKPALVALLRPGKDGWTVQDWQAFFDERAAIAEFDSGLPRREGEARAFRACVVEWLTRNPVRSAPDRCCWCGGGERGDNALLPFGAHRAGHAWLHSRCWRPWHEHRQAQAIAFLRALRIAAPSEFPNDFAKNGDA